VDARLGLARNLYWSRQVHEAIKQYPEVIRRSPRDDAVKLHLATVYLDRNMLPDA